MMGHHHLHLHRPLPSSSSSSSSSSSETTSNTLTSGPTCSCGANEVHNPSHIHPFHHHRQHSPLATAATNTLSGGGCGTTAFRTAFQPFNVSPTASESPEMAAALGHPFTSAQWKELERQAMIYKYMVASVPVPPDLLHPLTPNSTASLSSLGDDGVVNGSFFNLHMRFADGNKDPEPGRCKRTDGKKWRCSRDVVPNQKYCERHMNKGRSRSRKPVEPQQTPSMNSTAAANKRNRLLPPAPVVLPSVPTPQFLGSGPQRTEAPLFLNKMDQNQNHLSAPSYRESNRGLDWGVRGEMLTMETPDQQWNHMLQKNIGFGNPNDHSLFNQECNNEGSLNPIPYTDYTNQRPSSCNFFNRNCLEQSQIEEPRDFIDAWSSKIHHNQKDNNSSVSLTLSMEMASGNSLGGDETDQIQMGLGVGESDSHLKPQLAGWPSPVSWASSAAGGPLAEVLQSSVSSSYSSNAPANTASEMMPFQWLT